MYKLFKSDEYKRGLKKYQKAIKLTRLSIMEKILVESPHSHPAKIKKIKGAKHLYRYKIGEFRIFYEIDKPESLVYLIRVRPRPEAYRN